MRRLRELDQGVGPNANGMGAPLDVGDLAAVPSGDHIVTILVTIWVWVKI